MLRRRTLETRKRAAVPFVNEMHCNRPLYFAGRDRVRTVYNPWYSVQRVGTRSRNVAPEQNAGAADGNSPVTIGSGAASYGKSREESRSISLKVAGFSGGVPNGIGLQSIAGKDRW
ncbi:hypothetical protein N7462_010599 [Penicillium macrosclerotiorum]|uniref:uncharacterized protein n=1 Tax=Penicillium macrosclerotiorum TaxID=303699 RepID=UPI0025477ABE|nr:uncharacterized protein N7462_010599 [Penicillium macrosclerotiorum]KAJ5669529.1 hypothetical protein N7462_010599 [Penicillium macrosclerotiorum]